ncbi:hypothetical protein HY636_01920, partial [Candidatus Woesearchaeota archaeon]|nr:hypothetical protein [Candidatus Woesearchaeota archaeon]
EINTINNIIEELCPEFYKALQATDIERREAKRETRNESSTEGSTKDSISDLIIDVDKMELRETEMWKHLNTEFNEVMHSTEKFKGLVSKLYDVIASNAVDYLLAYILLTDIVILDDIYQVQEYDKNGFNPRQISIVEGGYEIDIERRGETYLGVKYSEEGDEIGNAKRRLPSSWDIMIDGIGEWEDKESKAGKRFLHRVVGLALKNRVNDAARRKGYNNCLLVPYKVDTFSLPKTLLVCEHRFNYDELMKAGYKV